MGGFSSAGWQGYGPKGEGVVGSAYGYQDQRLIGIGRYLVPYTAVDPFKARVGLDERATELCGGSYVLLNPADAMTPSSTNHGAVVSIL